MEAVDGIANGNNTIYTATHVGRIPEKPAAQVLHRCHICNKAFTRRYRLKIHIEAHKGQKFQCPLCPKLFHYKSSIWKHIKIHNREFMDKCDEGQTGYTYQVDLRQHKIAHLVELTKECDVLCLESRFDEHMQQHSVKPIHSYNCPLCKVSFSTTELFQEHMSIHADLKKLFGSKIDLNKHMDKHIHVNAQYNCPVCKETLSCQSALKTPMLQHGPKPYKCDRCGTQYSVQSGLLCHHRKKDPIHIDADVKRIKCTECRQVLVSKRSLKRHILLMHSQIFKCDICDKVFKTRAIFARHKKIIHSTERHVQCSVCGKSFKTAYNLREHESTHLEVKPYECDVCHKRFSWKLNLQRHKRVHLEIKPFICCMCGQGFTCGTHLRKHEQNEELHSNPTHVRCPRWRCKICKKPNFTYDKMVKHLETHENIHKTCYAEHSYSIGSDRQNDNGITKAKENNNDLIADEAESVMEDNSFTDKTDKNNTNEIHNIPEASLEIPNKNKLHSNPTRVRRPRWRCKICKKPNCSYDKMAKHLETHEYIHTTFYAEHSYSIGSERQNDNGIQKSKENNNDLVADEEESVMEDNSFTDENDKNNIKEIHNIPEASLEIPNKNKTFSTQKQSNLVKSTLFDKIEVKENSTATCKQTGTCIVWKNNRSLEAPYEIIVMVGPTKNSDNPILIEKCESEILNNSNENNVRKVANETEVNKIANENQLANENNASVIVNKNKVRIANESNVSKITNENNFSIVTNENNVNKIKIETKFANENKSGEVANAGSSMDRVLQKQHCCRLCDISFTHEKSLRKHIQAHIAGNQHECPICNKLFMFNNRFLAHLRTHNHSKIHSCRVCGDEVGTKMDLVRHSCDTDQQRRGFAQPDHARHRVLFNNVPGPSRDSVIKRQCKFNKCNTRFVGRTSLAKRHRKHTANVIMKPIYLPIFTKAAVTLPLA